MLAISVTAFLLTLAISCDSQCPQQVNSSRQVIYNRLYKYLTGTGAHNFEESVTIGFLGAYGDTEVTVGLGALPLAVDAVNADPTLLPGKRLNFVAADIGTNPRWPPLSLRAMTEMRDNGTVAFIGPDGTCISEALVAAAWNLPIISYRCADMAVSDKRVYHTFARTLPPSRSVSKSVVALLKAFEWEKFVIVSGKTAWALQVRNAVRGFAKEHGMTVTSEWEFTEYIPMLKVKIDKIVADSYLKTRVYVFIGEHVALVDFVKCLQERKLLDIGDYIVISVDDQIYDPDNKATIVERASVLSFKKRDPTDQSQLARILFPPLKRHAIRMMELFAIQDSFEIHPQRPIAQMAFSALKTRCIEVR